MGIQNWSEEIVLVNLAKEPEMGNEIQTVTGMFNQNGGFDVVIDFADVDIITSSSIAKLLKLRNAMKNSSHQLVLSSVKPQTKQVFEVTGIENVFEFVGDQFLALAGLQLAENK